MTRRSGSEDESRWESVRTLYAGAVNMWDTSASDSVGRLNGFGITNAALLGAVGVVLTSASKTGHLPPLSRVQMVLVALAEIAFTVVAAGAMLRTVAYARAYMVAARRCEALLMHQTRNRRAMGKWGSPASGKQLVAQMGRCDQYNDLTDGLGATMGGMQAGRRDFAGFVGWHRLANRFGYEAVVRALLLRFIILYAGVGLAALSGAV